MTLPTSPVDKNWPKGPNFLGIVIGSALAILLILCAAVLIMRGRAQKMVPVKTQTTPSQTRMLRAAPFASPNGVLKRASVLGSIVSA